VNALETLERATPARLAISEIVGTIDFEDICPWIWEFLYP
jgi:hypothetical protein